MKSIGNKTPGKSGKFEGVVIGDEHTGPEKVEYVCSWCDRSLVRLSDRNNQSESWFCRNCSIEFDSDDEKIRHKQRLSIPYEDSEPAVTSMGYDIVMQRYIKPYLSAGNLLSSKRKAQFIS